MTIIDPQAFREMTASVSEKAAEAIRAFGRVWFPKQQRERRFSPGTTFLYDSTFFDLVSDTGEKIVLSNGIMKITLECSDRALLEMHLQPVEINRHDFMHIPDELRKS